MKIIPLSEGSFTIDHTKVFIPFDNSKDDLQQRAKGSLLVEIQPFLIITNKDVVLLDTGLGFSEGGVLQIYNNLDKHGIAPTDVTKVLMSHLHRDHAGGLSTVDPYSGARHLAFPHANHYIQAKELDYALNGGSSSYDKTQLDLLVKHDKVNLLNDQGVIDGYIQYELSGGHSPFHQVFKIEEDDQVIFFGGDEAPQLKQMKTKFIAKYDHDGKRAMELRQQWWNIGKLERWTFLFYHDIQVPFYTIEE
ncbi:MAG: MBL fold metallo-hydrolase [bacterium]|jgi:glyoxylase-like metal-dependent hydrolase (beta-lactamase superfamily II)